MLLHGQALPNVGSLESNLDAMETTATKYPIAAWKVFTHYPDLWEGSGGWWLDDHEPGVPKVGERFIEKAMELGVPTICATRVSPAEAVSPRPRTSARQRPTIRTSTSSCTTRDS